MGMGQKVPLANLIFSTTLLSLLVGPVIIGENSIKRLPVVVIFIQKSS